MSFIRNCLKLIRSRENALVKNESGQVLVFFAVIGLVLVMFVGTITDYGQTVTKSITTQNAVDAAALAAGSWIARGGNIQQILNGIHFDMNLTLAQIIVLSSAICMIICTICMAVYLALMASVVLAPSAPPFLSAFKTTRSIEKTIINTCCTIHDAINTAINPVQKILVKATPLMAFVHANYAAHNNGADPLIEMLVDAVPFGGDVKNKILDFLELIDSTGIPPITTWTVSPNLFMWENMEVTEVFESPKTYKYLLQNILKPEWTHPYRLNAEIPFTWIYPWWAAQRKKLDWADSFIMQKSKKRLMMSKYQGWGIPDPGFDLSIDIIPQWFKDLIDELKQMFADILDAISDFFSKIWDILFGWLPDIDLPCIGDSEDGTPLKIDDPENEAKLTFGVEDICHFTFICGTRSRAGTFLQMFGPTIEQDPDANNVPMTWALATVKVRGHPIHPGGLIEKDDGTIGQLELTVAPFWISCKPFFPQVRLVEGYVSDWEAMLAPVMFQISSGTPKEDIDFKNLWNILKQKGKFSKLFKLSKWFKDSYKTFNGVAKPTRIPGKYLGINH